LIQDAVGWQSKGCLISHLLVVLFALAGGGEQHDFTLCIDQNVILNGMTLLFATVEGLLLRSILGSLDRALSSILKVEFDLIAFQVQSLRRPHRASLEGHQSLVETLMKAMNPLVGHRLRHVKNFTKDILRGRLPQIHQDKQQFVGRGGQRAVPVTHIRPLTQLAGQSEPLHLSEKALAECRQQSVKLFYCVARQGQKLFRFGRKNVIIGHVSGLLV
jgi:hypothetical protein